MKSCCPNPLPKNQLLKKTSKNVLELMLSFVAGGAITTLAALSLKCSSIELIIKEPCLGLGALGGVVGGSFPLHLLGWTALAVAILFWPH